MRPAVSAALSLHLMLLASCARQPPKVAATPAPPQPAPPAPRVYPQNVEHAPPAQPIPPDAVPALSRGGLAIAPEPETAPAPPVIVRRPAATAPARPGAAPTPEPETPPAVAATPARPPSALQSRNDRTRNRAAIEAQISQTAADLRQLKSRALPAAANDDRERATSMLDLARKAVARGDLRQADDLSSRAAILARTLLHAN